MQFRTMALVKRSVVLVLMMPLFQVMNAAIYKVGDSAGWTTIGNIDYKQWSATKTFQVGDIIVFEYNSQFHNVMRVTHAMYRACNASAPFATYTTGNDSITIKTRGHHFFFCGVPGHCQAGQKVDINVPHHQEVIAPTPASSSSSSSTFSPAVPAARIPGPSTSNAISFMPSDNLAFGVAVLATLGFSFA
ncbi:mavicyanin [Manihot esculenta]|uniref:Phytocyanin domain-containing protein n=1 Tax=Manihot esculenta TaxID=3983 RepID=A0A2C9WAR0_MANES|nr:mavicyanin [Manihot esculenta]